MEKDQIDYYFAPSEQLGPVTNAERYRRWDDEQTLKRTCHLVPLCVKDLIEVYAADIAMRRFLRLPITPAYVREKLQSFLSQVDSMRKVEQCTQS